jgi:hypothetical protein
MATPVGELFPLGEWRTARPPGLLEAEADGMPAAEQLYHLPALDRQTSLTARTPWRIGANRWEYNAKQQGRRYALRVGNTRVFPTSPSYSIRSPFNAAWPFDATASSAVR